MVHMKSYWSLVISMRIWFMDRLKSQKQSKTIQDMFVRIKTHNKHIKANRIICRIEIIKVEFQFHLQIASSLHKLHVLNNYTYSTIIQYNQFNIPIQLNEEHYEHLHEQKKDDLEHEDWIPLLVSYQHIHEIEDLNIKQQQPNSPSRTKSNTRSSKQIQTSISLILLSWNRWGARFTRISRWSIGMISRFVKLTHYHHSQSYNSLFLSIKSFRINSYSVPNLYLTFIISQYTYDKGVRALKPGSLISLPVPYETTFKLFFLQSIKMIQQILQTNHELPYFDSHWKNISLQIDIHY